MQIDPNNSFYLSNCHEGRKHPCKGLGTGPGSSNSARPSSTRVLASNTNKPEQNMNYVYVDHTEVVLIFII